MHRKGQNKILSLQSLNAATRDKESPLTILRRLFQKGPAKHFELNINGE